MPMQHLNYWAILVAAISAFFLGGLWYSPLLLEPLWKKVNGFGAGEPPAATPKVFAVSFI